MTIAQDTMLDANGDEVHEGDVVLFGRDSVTVEAIVLDVDVDSPEVGHARLRYADGDDDATPLFWTGVGIPQSIDITLGQRNPRDET